MNHSLGMAIESLVAILLMLTIVYCVMLNKRLTRLPVRPECCGPPLRQRGPPNSLVSLLGNSLRWKSGRRSMKSWRALRWRSVWSVRRRWRLVSSLWRG